MITKKEKLRIVAGFLISSQITLHYIEEMKRILIPQQKLKNLVNNTIKHLRTYEKDYDVIESFETDGSFSKVSAEHFDFIEMMMSAKSEGDRLNHKRYFMAYQENPKAVLGIVDKVLKHNKKDM